MTTDLSKLLAVSSPALVEKRPDAHDLLTFLGCWNLAGQELGDLLSVRNGFYAFEYALLVRPFRRGAAPLGIVEWNEPGLWKCSFSTEPQDALFFAEDIFGVQFCILDNRIHTFDPETGHLQELCNSLQDWLAKLSGEYDVLTGLRLAHAWQQRHGPLPKGSRLLPKVPFVLEGRYDLENFYVLEEVEGMRFRAGIARQLRDVPDGAKIVVRLQKDP